MLFDFKKMIERINYKANAKFLYVKDHHEIR